MKVKYVVRENGKFAVKEEKFLPAIRTFETQEEALNFLKEEFAKAEEKFEIQVQQENGEFRAFDIPSTTPAPEVAPAPAPEVAPAPAPEVAPAPAPEVAPAPAPEVALAPAPEVAPAPAPEVAVAQAPAPTPEVAVATATPEVAPVTGVQAAPVTTTLNVEEEKVDANADTKTKFNIKDLWKNPEYRKWLYLGIAVFIEVAIIIAIIVLIAG